MVQPIIKTQLIELLKILKDYQEPSPTRAQIWSDEPPDGNFKPDNVYTERFPLEDYAAAETSYPQLLPFFEALFLLHKKPEALTQEHLDSLGIGQQDQRCTDLHNFHGDGDANEKIINRLLKLGVIQSVMSPPPQNPQAIIVSDIDDDPETYRLNPLFSAVGATPLGQLKAMIDEINGSRATILERDPGRADVISPSAMGRVWESGRRSDFITSLSKPFSRETAEHADPHLANELSAQIDLAWDRMVHQHAVRHRQEALRDQERLAQAKTLEEAIKDEMFKRAWEARLEEQREIEKERDRDHGRGGRSR